MITFIRQREKQIKERQTKIARDVQKDEKERECERGERDMKKRGEIAYACVIRVRKRK